jgi:hypothetical protein
MKNSKRPKLLAALILSAVLLSTACGPVFATLRLAIASATPLVTVLVARGVITQKVADTYVADFNATVDSIAQLDADWKTATTKAQKLVAIQKAANAWAAIVARGDFGAAPTQLAIAVQIINALFDTAVQFYSGQPSRVPGAAPGPQTEQELKDLIHERAKTLKATLAVK